MTDPDSLQELVRLLRRHAELTRYATQMQVLDSWSREIDRPRNANPKRLARHGYKVFSQNDEDGITFEIRRNKCMRDRHWVRGSQFPGAPPGGFPEAAPQPSPPPPPPPPAAATTEAPDWCRGPGQEWLGTACLTRGR